jgi:hypothetical protein
LKFNKAFSRNLLAEAQARDVEIRNAITKAREGIISADQAAQELGYESAYDPSILEESSTLAQALQVLHEGFAGKAKREFTFQFDKQTGKYKFVQTVIQIDTKKEFANIGNVVEIKKKTQLQRVSN